MKLNFEIAVDQQSKVRDQIFEGVPDSGCPPVPAGQPVSTPLFGQFLVQFFQITTSFTKNKVKQESAKMNKILKGCSNKKAKLEAVYKTDETSTNNATETLQVMLETLF